MRPILKDILLPVSVIAALFAVAWFTSPIDRPSLRMVQSCTEISRLGTQHHTLTPAEKIDLVNCATH
jgi:hypothetical protein